MRARRTAAALAVAVTSLALAACHTQGGRSDSSTGSVTIMVGGLDKVIYLPAELTARLGYFAQQGIKVNLEEQPSGAVAETSLIAGEVDGVVGFYDHTIDLQTKHKCLESVVQFAAVPGEVEMVSAKAASSVTGPRDFAGKNLGITSPGSSTDFLTQYLAVSHGVSISKYTTVTAGAGAQFIAALQNGQISAGMTTDPTVEQAVQKGVGSVLLDMRTLAGTRAALGGLYPGSSLYLDCDYVSSHPQTVQKLATAFVRTLHFIATHTGAQIAARMPTDYSQGSGGITTYAKAITASKGMFTADGVMPAGGPENALKVQGTSNPDVVGHTGSIDLSRTYTTAFAKAAGRG